MQSTGDKRIDQILIEGHHVSKRLMSLGFVGLFFFGPISIAAAFRRMARPVLGWFYALGLALTILLAISVFAYGGVDLATLPMVSSPLVIYIGAWLHVIVIANQYQKIARRRIDLIEKSENPDIDSKLLAGLLWGHVLSKKDRAIPHFKDGLEVPGGDADLLGLAGRFVLVLGRHGDAYTFVSRAMEKSNSLELRQLKNLIVIAARTGGRIPTYTVSKYCPVCGSDRVVKMKGSLEMSVTGDRRCDSCGLEWTPSLPTWAAIVFTIGLVLLFLLAAGITISALAEQGISLGVLIGFVIALGFGHLGFEAFARLVSPRANAIRIRRLPTREIGLEGTVRNGEH
jgi:predicted RNA-binding Zn-ribbon protein involved in translation (DUF1610 family)